MRTTLVDTSVWSLALRRARTSDHPAVDRLRELINDGRAALIGPIRQEILSGIRDRSQFRTLRQALRAFPDLALATHDHEHAAELSNRCRAAGVQGSGTDFLICAVALRGKMPILTTDRDFEGFAEVVPIEVLAK